MIRPAVIVAHGGVVIGAERTTRPHLGDRCALRGKHQVVQRALLRRKFSVDRKRAGDVGRVALVFGAGVDQQQVAVVQRARCWRGSAARSRSRRRRRSARTTAPRRGDGMCAAIPPRSRARSCRAARCASRARAPRRRSSPPAHDAQFVARLVQAQVVQDVAECDELMRRARAALDLAAHVVDPADQF